MSGALWSADEIAAATGGKVSGGHGGGDWSVVGVSIDSRTVLPGELFIALRGPNHDGHRFVQGGAWTEVLPVWSIASRRSSRKQRP